GKKSCTRPTDPAPGNRKGEPVGRALHGPLMIAVFKIDGEEVARSLVEVTVQEDGIHYTAEPLYEEGGFNQSQAFAEILMKDATLLGIDPSQVHIHFSGLNMKSLPILLPASFSMYNDSFPRSNVPAPHYGFSS
ncbi:MAG: hypothetical protein U1D33_03095, partial [bacterium]|nr:hypothetical protein [bacterium]